MIQAIEKRVTWWWEIVGTKQHHISRRQTQPNHQSWFFLFRKRKQRLWISTEQLSWIFSFPPSRYLTVDPFSSSFWRINFSLFSFPHFNFLEEIQLTFFFCCCSIARSQPPTVFGNNIPPPIWKYTDPWQWPRLKVKRSEHYMFEIIDLSHLTLVCRHIESLVVTWILMWSSSAVIFSNFLKLLKAWKIEFWASAGKHKLLNTQPATARKEETHWNNKTRTKHRSEDRTMNSLDGGGIICWWDEQMKESLSCWLFHSVLKWY